MAAAATSTTTLPPSPEDQGGVFDAPFEKCPPDIQGGSSDWVTDSLTHSKTAPSPIPRFSNHSSNNNSSNNNPSSVAPLPIPHFRPSTTAVEPLTPESSPNTTRAPLSVLNSLSAGPHGHGTHKPGSIVTGLETPPTTPEVLPSSGAADFLSAIFPRAALRALPYARGVRISSPQSHMNAVFEGVVLQLPDAPRTLYVNGAGAEYISLRESIVALLDLADEHLECSCFVIALDKKSPALGGLLHSLMYVGGTIVTRPPFPVDDAFVLVGIEI